MEDKAAKRTRPLRMPKLTDRSETGLAIEQAKKIGIQTNIRVRLEHALSMRTEKGKME